MRKHDTDSSRVAELKISGQISTKHYHSPQLTEWGDLQDITKGPGNSNDDLNQTGSQFGGRPQPVDPNRPWPKNYPNP